MPSSQSANMAARIHFLEEIIMRVSNGSTGHFYLWFLCNAPIVFVGCGKWHCLNVKWSKEYSLHNDTLYPDFEMLIYLCSGFENVVISSVSGHKYRKWYIRLYFFHLIFSFIKLHPLPWSLREYKTWNSNNKDKVKQ